MGKYWWVTWIKVLALTAVFAVVIVLGYRQVKKSVADYLVDAPADAKLTDKLNLEDMVFDYAGEFVDRMMEESEQIRNAITEPLAFMFCFSAPILWVAHACISGLFIVLLHIFHVTGFTTNLLGSVLMNLSAGADKTNYPTLYLLALCQIAVYFVVFTLLIKAFNLHTPGREEGSAETAKSDAPAKKASVKNAAEVQCVIDGLGGKENILSVDNCFTRLRVNIKDPAKLDEAAINKLPNSGIVKKGTDIQIVYGLQVADIKRAVEAQLENQ